MNDRIAQALTKLFDRHRIVFWYDAKQELRDDFEALSAARHREAGTDQQRVRHQVPAPARAAGTEIPALPRRPSARRSG